MLLHGWNVANGIVIHSAGAAHGQKQIHVVTMCDHMLPVFYAYGVYIYTNIDMLQCTQYMIRKYDWSCHMYSHNGFANGVTIMALQCSMHKDTYGV